MRFIEEKRAVITQIGLYMVMMNDILSLNLANFVMNASQKTELEIATNKQRKNIRRLQSFTKVLLFGIEEYIASSVFIRKVRGTKHNNDLVST